MPYATNADLPAAVKGALPSGAQDIWRGAYQGFTKSNPDAKEDAAYKVAWAAVKKKYKKVEDNWVEMHDEWSEAARAAALEARRGNLARSGEKKQSTPLGRAARAEIEGLRNEYARVGREQGWDHPDTLKVERKLLAAQRKYGVVKDAAAAPLQMCDAATLHVDLDDEGRSRRTGDGYLTGYAKIARTGVQTYKGREVGRPDLGDVKVYRPPDEVFSRDAMHSMAHRPVTLHHPPETVTSRNWKKYSIGHTGDEVVRDGDYIRVPMVVMDHAAIDAVENGDAKELSVGYSTDLQWKKGRTEDGETYDAVQTAIRGNHLAIVPQARGGGKLRIGDNRAFWDKLNGMQDGEDGEPDSVEVNVPLLIRLMEHAREDMPAGEAGDEAIHKLAERAVDLSNGECLGMDDYDKLTADGMLGDDKDEHGYGSYPRDAHGERLGPGDKVVHGKERPGGQVKGFMVHTVVSTRENAGQHYALIKNYGGRTGEHRTAMLTKIKDGIDDAIESNGPARERDPEADRHLRLMMHPKVAPSRRKQAGEDLMNYLTENHGEEDGKRRYDEMTAGIDITRDGAMLSRDRDFSAGERDRLSKTGAAMPDGSFPINNTGDLRNAVKAVGRAKDYAAAKRHIIKRARALGATGELPEDWTKSTKDAAPRGRAKGVSKMMTTLMVDGIPVELDDRDAAIVEQKFAKLQSELRDAKGKADKAAAEKEEAEEEDERQQKDAKAKIDAKDGEIAVLKKHLADAQAANTPAVLDAAVKARLATISKAATVLDKSFVFDGKSDLDIKRAAVAKRLSDAVAKDMSDATIDGAFVALTADAKKAPGGTDRLAASIRDHNQRTEHMTGDGVDIRDAAMAEQEKYLTNAWRTPMRSA